MADKNIARKRTYNKISDVQRLKLQEFYDDDMKTCGSFNVDKIEKAAEETGMTIEQVKVGFILPALFEFLCQKCQTKGKNQYTGTKPAPKPIRYQRDHVAHIHITCSVQNISSQEVPNS